MANSMQAKQWNVQTCVLCRLGSLLDKLQAITAGRLLFVCYLVLSAAMM